MLKKIEISGFKSFAKKTSLSFDTPITGIVGPNGSGKSNVVEAIRFVLGEQSMKSLRGKGSSDLIWKGSKFLGALSKGRVSITFDNKDRRFTFSGSSGASADLAFDEVTLSREVASDGGSNYSINGTSVRLKDVTDLLASVHIGASGHHIISQGEADRLLSASARDRRAMVEDALGLKIYQIRIRDSERKLEKTGLNMKEVSALRRELAPHLAFLGKQVEKIQKAEELRREFSGLINEYANNESASIMRADAKLQKEETTVREELAGIEKIRTTHTESAFEGEKAEVNHRLRTAEEKNRNIMREREELTRALGRIEGKLDALTGDEVSAGVESVSAGEVKKLCGELLKEVEYMSGASDMTIIREVLAGLKTKLRSFVTSLEGGKINPNREEIRATVRREKEALETKLRTIENSVAGAQGEISALRSQLADIEGRARLAERDTYAGVARAATLEGILRECMFRREAINHRKAQLAEELREAEALIGGRVNIHQVNGEDTSESIATREALHKKLERIKIKLEDVGGGSGSDVLKEYEDTKARDEFLTRELADIEASIVALRGLIAELRDTIERRFKEGVEKINVQFTEFFKLMFGGGGAFLSIVVEHKRTRGSEEDGDAGDIDEDALSMDHGLEINVSLPHKKVRDLNMLSGGERSLVSIALLFAMSQVNPPPFLVLDETDAALDEANSRRYGDMLGTLSSHSKLIVVTHNRETMSRAEVLYGVTMGADGASKLLSIKFDEAVAIAK